MRCAIFVKDEGLERRLRRIQREQGWQLVEIDLAVEHGASTYRDIDLALIGGWPRNVMPDMQKLRRVLPLAIILVLGEVSLEARTRAFANGATDFIQHDASSRYLTARVGALMRLRKVRSLNSITAGDIEIDIQHRRSRIGGRELPLSQKEFDLLALLARHYDATLTRSELIEGLWQAAPQAEDNTLDVHVSRLRRKLRTASTCRIATVRGIGYRLCSNETPLTDFPMGQAG